MTRWERAVRGHLNKLWVGLVMSAVSSSLNRHQPTPLTCAIRTWSLLWNFQWRQGEGEERRAFEFEPPELVFLLLLLL